MADMKSERVGNHSDNRTKLALMKCLYLTACLDMGAPPNGVVADQVRGELVTARDAPSREAVPRSDLALSLHISRSHQDVRVPNTPAASIAVAQMEGGPRWGALLVGNVFVEFPPGFPVAGVNEAAA
jgi:hypothetical protein